MRDTHKNKYRLVPYRIKSSDGVVRSSISAFRADDPGPNPGRSIRPKGTYYSFLFYMYGTDL